MSIYSEHAANVSRIRREIAQIEADTIRRKGDFWGGTLQMLGQLPMEIIARREAGQAARDKTARDEEDRELKIAELAQKLGLPVDPTRLRALRGIAGEPAAPKTPAEQVEALRQSDPTKAAQLQDTYNKTAAKMLYGATAENWKARRASAIRYLSPEFQALLPEELESKDALAQILTGLSGDVAKVTEHPKVGTRTVDTIGADGKPVTRIVEDVAGAEYPKPPTKGTTASVGSLEDYIIKRYGENPTDAQILQARKDYNQSDDKPAASSGLEADDVTAIADAIIAGEQPPLLTGLYRNGAGVRAALARKGFNLADATTDWVATQKHVSTLNGAQQTRMAQAVDNAYHSLDVIEDLAKQWDGGKFPILNKAKLAAAKQGALGPKAQQIATQLEAQISDVTSELGNVYMGGNSPTDHALTLAAKNLSADWTKDQLMSALKLARKNLQIRQNSMRNVGVAGAGATNPYAQQPPAAPAAAPTPTGRYNPATGKVEPIR